MTYDFSDGERGNVRDNMLKRAEERRDKAEDAIRRYLLSDFSEESVFHFLIRRLEDAQSQLRTTREAFNVQQ